MYQRRMKMLRIILISIITSYLVVKICDFFSKK
nr:MAG TPA: hypothetical protein [Caudoviricetes sp.]DAS67295.1 MAG TPA: hypothetical protein [Caudoviricetes sp.]DAW59704.1 MAG TPA: hypothetical protein [Caudoviricetes sp.]